MQPRTPIKGNTIPRDMVQLVGDARKSKDAVNIMVTVGWPLELLRCGITIIDSPGVWWGRQPPRSS